MKGFCGFVDRTETNFGERKNKEKRVSDAVQTLKCCGGLRVDQLARSTCGARQMCIVHHHQVKGQQPTLGAAVSRAVVGVCNVNVVHVTSEAPSPDAVVTIVTLAEPPASESVVVGPGSLPLAHA